MTGGRFGSGWRRGRLQVLSSSLATVWLPSRAYPVTVRFPFGWQDAYAATAHSAPYLDAESLMFRRPAEGKRWHRSLRASRSREAPKRYSRTSRTLRICPNGKGVSSLPCARAGKIEETALLSRPRFPGLFFIAHSSRRVWLAGVTRNPSGA